MGLGQNGVVLAFFEPKRRRFGYAIFFFGNLPITKRRRFGKNWSKTASFWSSFHIPKTMSFGLVTAASKRRRFGPILSKTTSFCNVFKIKNKKETTSFYLLQRQNDVVSPAPKPKYKNLFLIPACSERGEGKTRHPGRRPLVGIEDLT